MALVDAIGVVHRARREEDVVISAMGAAREWMALGTRPLDWVFVPSSMGQATALGLGLALAWMAAVLIHGPRNPEFYQSAFDRMFEAMLGALTSGGILWVMRAAYFYLRGIEGLGLGDVKMMAVVGAFFNWQGAIQVLIVGSIIGLIVGLALVRGSGRGLQTRLPLGVCLGIAAVLILLLFDTGILPVI